MPRLEQTQLFEIPNKPGITVTLRRGFVVESAPNYH